MKKYPITEEMRKQIAEKLKDNYFAKVSPYAYELSMSIINKAQTRHDLRPYIIHYEKEDLHVRNLLSVASRFLLHQEPIELEVGQKVIVPTFVRNGKEPAVILEINRNDYLVLVKPIRDGALEMWISTDHCKPIIESEVSNGKEED